MTFEDSFNTDPTNINNDFYNFNDEDPAAEFLARDKRDLAGITGNGNENDHDDPFNRQSNNIDRNSPFKNGGHSPMFSMGGSDSPSPNSNPSPYQALSQLDEHMNEPEKLRKWKEEFAARISKKDADEDSKRHEMRDQAKKELDDFYKQRVEQMERTRGQNRSNNRTFEDDLLNNGNSSSKSSNGKVHDWDKITSLCEFNPKNNRAQKDLTRYRSVLLQLKQQTTGK